MNRVNTNRSERDRRLSLREKWAKNRFDNLLKNITCGSVTVVGCHGRTDFGSDNELSGLVTVRKNRFYRKAMNGPLSIAESYIDGDWDCHDVTTLIRIFLRNRQAIDQSRNWRIRLASFGYRAFHWLHSNTRRGSLNNIAAHYDLGNDFYKLWLDDTLAYSSGIFLDDQQTMKDASLEKFDRICRTLDLGPGDQLLEIGTGFGGFALHAAEQYRCNVTTTTISSRQHELANSRFASSDAGHRIKLLQKDYRDLEGKFNKIASIEMIEAVGHKYLDQFFQKCSSLLRTDGSMVIQAIVMPEQRYARYLNNVDFIQRYVFPGGSLPSLAAMLESVGRQTDMRFVHAQDMAPHYAETLRRWRISFESQLDEVRAQGYPERMIRLWRFYLSYCEAAFVERQIGLLQIQFDKPGCQRDPIEIGNRAATQASPDQPANGLAVSKLAENGFPNDQVRRDTRMHENRNEVNSECC